MALSQGISATASSSGTATTGSVTTTSGSAIEVHVTGTGTTAPTVSDSKGNTYTQVGTRQVINGGFNGSHWRFKNESGTRGSSHTFSATGSDTTIFVTEIIGTNPTVDVHNEGTDTSTTYDSPSVTPTVADFLAVAGIASDNAANPTDYTAGASFTERVTQENGSLYWTGALATRIVTGGSGSYNSSWTSTRTLSNSTHFITVWKEGSSGYTITCEQGSITLTGQSVTTRLGRKMAANQGSVALTGQNVTLTYGAAAKVLVAEQGALALTGQAVTPRAARRVTAQQGALALTGQAVGVKSGRRITAQQGAYTVTGSNALADFAITLAQGSYTFTGQAATPRAARRVTAQQGALALTGQSVGVRAGFPLVAVSGSYTLTGQQVTLDYSGAALSLVAELGTITLTGGGVSLVTSRRQALEQGAFALTGFSAALDVSRRLSAAAGAYSITGYPQELTYDGAGDTPVYEDEPRFRVTAQGRANRLGMASGGVEEGRLGSRQSAASQRRLGGRIA